MLDLKECVVHTKSVFRQGVFAFEGQGLEKPAPIDESLRYVVPFGATGQALYFRGGNSSDALVVVVLFRDGVPMRYFPIGARDGVHVALRVVEDLDGGTELDLRLAAPEGVLGSVVIDFGLVEV
jgi:assimilatory nitrate reductase catalytic subunit